MDPTIGVAGLWVLFAGTHMVLSGRALRPRLLALLGPGGFRAAYSVVALVTFVALVRYYFAHKHAGPMLWVAPPGEVLRHLLFVGNSLAFTFVAAGLATPSPVVPGAPSWEPRGVQFITRHAVFMGVGLWGLMHLVPFGFGTDVVFFGGFVVFALLGSWHQDRRKLAEGDERFLAYHRATAFIPFTGPHTARGLRELSVGAVLVGVGASVVVRYFHASWFA